MGNGSKKSSIVILMPAIMLFVVLPFTILYHMQEMEVAEYPYFPDYEAWGDLFLYAKSVVTLVAAVLASVLIFDYKFIQGKKIKISKMWIAMLIFELACIFSYVFSINTPISSTGFFDQYENIWVCLAYGILCFYGYFLYDKVPFQNILRILVVPAFVLSVLGLSQFFSHDIIQMSGLIESLLPDSFQGQVAYDFAGEQIKKVYLTFYNPNYAAVYLDFVLPFLMLGFFIAPQKSWKGLYGITCIGFLICLIGTGSKAGIMVCAIEVLVMSAGILVYQMKYKKNNFLIVIATLAVIVILCFLGYKFADLDEEKISSNLDEELQQVTVYEDKIGVRFHDTELFLWEKDIPKENRVGVYVSDDKGKLYSYTYNAEKNALILDEKKFSDFCFGCFEQNGISYLFFRHNDINWTFTKDTPKGVYSFISTYGKLENIESAEKAYSTKFDGLFTYRGYIWNRTVPLLKKYFLMGSGPNTFGLVFPQNDYVDRSKAGSGFYYEILTKPHNMYLQTAVQTGVVSCMALLVFGGLCMKTLFQRLYKACKKNNDFNIKILMTFIIAIMAYCILGITNDSSVAVAPTFWLLSGLGIGMTMSENK